MKVLLPLFLLAAGLPGFARAASPEFRCFNAEVLKPIVLADIEKSYSDAKVYESSVRFSLRPPGAHTAPGSTPAPLLVLVDIAFKNIYTGEYNKLLYSVEYEKFDYTTCIPSVSDGATAFL